MPNQTARDPQTKTATASPPRPSAETARARSAYTLRLFPDEAAAFDALLLRIRGQLGRRVHKDDILRALLQLAAECSDVREAIGVQIDQRAQEKRAT